MKKILLKSNKYGNKEVLIDDEDYNKLIQFTWSLNFDKNNFYARHKPSINKDPKRIAIRMHRMILNLDKDDQRLVDHIDHNGLNNQKSNLRICNKLENKQNSRKSRKNSLNSIPSSKFKGVYEFKGWTKYKNKKGIVIKYPYSRWVAEFKIPNAKRIKKYFPFTVEGEIEAVKWYNEQVIIYNAKFGYLNIIDFASTQNCEGL